MKSIPTMYRGTRLRSRLEADVAFLLDAIGVPVPVAEFAADLKHAA